MAKNGPYPADATIVTTYHRTDNEPQECQHGPADDAPRVVQHQLPELPRLHAGARDDYPLCR
jgi:hypothetical protein